MKHKFKVLDDFAERSRARAVDLASKLEVMDLEKLTKTEFGEFVGKTATDEHDNDIRLDSYKSNLLTLEHYCERYVPIKIQ